MKVAVTSASGHLGSEIVRATAALLGAESLIGLARTPAKAEHLGVEIRPGDYNEAHQLRDSLQSVDTLLLVSGTDEPSKRVGQHRNVINAAKAAGDGKCGYTTRPELGYAYARMLTDARHNGKTYNLHGEPITQAQLARVFRRPESIGAATATEGKA